MFQLWAGQCEAAKQSWLKLEKKGLLAAGWTANAGFSDDIWSLDLNTFLWTKLSPGGVPPSGAAGQRPRSHGDKIWIFGGFGAPPSNSQSLQLGLSGGEYVPLHSERGLSNQLVKIR